MGREAAMVYSYTQISQYLRCPRSYRYRYLDGWREKDTRAAMIFGRCFEKALAAYFCQEDGAAALFREWGAYRDAPLEYGKGESWDKLIHQGVHLLQMFAQADRIRRVVCQAQMSLLCESGGIERPSRGVRYSSNSIPGPWGARRLVIRKRAPKTLFRCSCSVP
jgi:CRISPR/Cas system-associated exonuclease Cas4 (RecB family)